MKKYIGSVLIVVLTVWVFLMTTLPATRSFVNSLFLLYLAIAFLGSLYFPVARKSIRSEAVLGSYMLLIFVSVLFWVGVTGWFFSPVFYVLYLLAIMLSFIATPFSTLLFVLTLIGLFIPNIGSIDVTLDMITVFSLFSIVPITFFLQKEYLRLREQDKKVLILEEETSDMRNKVEEVLRNKIIRFAVTVRQPVNDIKQMAIVAQKDEKN
ncbi:MAG: hypothetical protein WBO77_05020, partial [Microgenomates group bacterium]